MMIEFKNEQTERVFKHACQPSEFELKCKRGAFLLKNALYWEGV
jgi:hypothetical protein